MFDVPDHAQYWSWITASRRSLFISNTMTPETNAAIFANPAMWALAQAQIGFGLSFPVLFQWWRVLAIVLLVPVVAAFIRTLVPEREHRVTALLIALLGSGFGWLLIVAKKVAGSADVPWPTDLYTVEPNTFWSILAYPHIALAHALLLMTMLGSWLAYRGKGWGYWLLAAIAGASLSVSHAYDLITVYAVLAVYGAVIWIRDRQFPTRLTAVGLVVAGCSGPAALYYQRLTSSDPLWRAVLSQVLKRRCLDSTSSALDRADGRSAAPRPARCHPSHRLVRRTLVCRHLGRDHDVFDLPARRLSDQAAVRLAISDRRVGRACLAPAHSAGPGIADVIEAGCCGPRPARLIDQSVLVRVAICGPAAAQRALLSSSRSNRRARLALSPRRTVRRRAGPAGTRTIRSQLRRLARLSGALGDDQSIFRASCECRDIF